MNTNSTYTLADLVIWISVLLFLFLGTTGVAVADFLTIYKNFFKIRIKN